MPHEDHGRHSRNLKGIVQRVTYHNSDSGWSVLRISPFNNPGSMETITVHQTQVFAGATMEVHGAWTFHPQFGRQFKAERAIEKKPATAAALEKYLGSGLIHGVGPKTAARIVGHFQQSTLEVFENDIGRLIAAVRHVLAAGREQGHCFLFLAQIRSEVGGLLGFDPAERLSEILQFMEDDNQLKVRMLTRQDADEQLCYYSKSLYYDEAFVARTVRPMAYPLGIEGKFVDTWVERHCREQGMSLSAEQAGAVRSIAASRFSVLTGGPGCGKTTTTLVIVRLLEHLGKRVLLTAPTGRAAQRMSEVIGREAKTLHRLLEWQNGTFQKNQEQPLCADVLIVDECSMLDISLTASLLKAVPPTCQVLLIGDADQLPAVGAGNVLRDIILSGTVAVFRLTEVFRQARASKIIEFAHQLNRGITPHIDSPFKKPELWVEKVDCLFIDTDEATKEQMDFVTKVKKFYEFQTPHLEGLTTAENLYEFRTEERIYSSYEQDFVVPKKFQHVDLQKLQAANGSVNELKAVLAKVHPWSTLHYGFAAVDAVVRLYM